MAQSHPHAWNVIRSEKGKQFGPRVVEAFFAREAEILDVQVHFREAEDARRKMIDARQEAWNW